MSDLLEKDIKKIFYSSHIPSFERLIESHNLRLYAIELPVITSEDGTKYADIVLEVDDVRYSKDNELMVLEFKKDKVDHQSAVAQVLRYADVIQKQLYRRKKVRPFVIAPLYSEHEIKLANAHNVTCVQYDYLNGTFKIMNPDLVW